jgi:hypothetical protein
MAGKEKEEVKAKEEEVKPVIPDDEEQGAKPPEGVSPEEWADLSDAEKEGIFDKGEDEEEEGIDDETLEAIAGEEEEVKADEKKEEKKEEKAEAKKPEEKEEKKVEKEPEKEPEKKAEVVAEEKKEEPEKKAEEPPTILSDEQLLRFHATVTEADLPTVDTVSPEIQAKLDELDTKYDAGELDLKTYNKQRDTLNRQVNLENVKTLAAARDQKIWEKEQAHFLRNRPEYIDKSMKGNALFGALGEAIRTLNNDPKFAGATGIELLIAADQAVKESFDMSPKKPEKKEPEPKKKEVVERKPAATIPEVKTLADVPNAAANPTESWASALDKLQGEAYEAALEKLSPEQRDRYLAAR